MRKKHLILGGLLLSIALPLAHAHAGTVLSSNKYAWSDNVGYVNFENVIVNDSALSGFAWSANTGWIKLDPTQGGVIQDGQGNLSGSAWGEQLGWIDFSNVSISPTTGKFSGIATGTLIGSLTFDCPTYCDVVTDWRPPVTPPPPTGDNYTNGGVVDWCTNIPNVQSFMPDGYHSVPGTSTCAPNPEIVPVQIVPEMSPDSGLENVQIETDKIYTENLKSGLVTVKVPAGDTPSSFKIIISIEPLSKTNEYLTLKDLQLIDSVFYNVTAENESGNQIHFFKYPITITLPVPINLRKARDLGAYWFNETNNQWVLIPDAVFTHYEATFQVDHLTKFAIFGTIDETVTATPTDEPVTLQLPLPSLPLQTIAAPISVKADGNYYWLILSLLLILLLIYIKYKYDHRKANDLKKKKKK